MTTGRLRTVEGALADLDIESMSPGQRERLLKLLSKRSALLGMKAPALPWVTNDPAELPRLFAPHFFTAPMADFHIDFWRHVMSIEAGVRPPPICAFWSRGFGKSATAEIASIVLAAHRRRSYFIYVSKTQELADGHVAAIAAVLEESPYIQQHFPALAQRKIGKYGPKAWRRNRLMAGEGHLRFTIDAVGLDVSVRGRRIEEERPGGLILDDLDDTEDSPATVDKKIRTLTQALIPMGARDLLIIYCQNLVHDNSIASRIARPQNFDEDQRLLGNAVVLGPVPAVEGFSAEQIDRADGKYGWRITAGRPTWAGMPLVDCEAMLNDMGLVAFQRECLHDTAAPPGGIFSHLKFRHVDWDDVPWEKVLDIQVWVDPAVTSKDDSDCMAICAMAVDTAGELYLLHSWEQRTTPEDAIRRAVLVAHDLGASTVGVETNQGGDLWEFTFGQVCEQLERETDGEGEPLIDRRPKFDEARASSGLSKAERAQRALSIEYEQGRILHVRTGTEHVASKALYRFPKTAPHDWTDAHAWAVTKLRDLVPIRPLRADAFGPDADSAWKMPEAVPRPAVNGYSGSVWDTL